MLQCLSILHRTRHGRSGVYYDDDLVYHHDDCNLTCTILSWYCNFIMYTKSRFPADDNEDGVDDDDDDECFDDGHDFHDDMKYYDVIRCGQARCSLGRCTPNHDPTLVPSMSGCQNNL